MKHSKIAIVGVGNVGASIAYALMLSNITAEILLYDINQDRCKGEFLDLSDALSFSTTSILKNAKPEEISQADIIIITAGSPQKPGQTRLDLFSINKKVLDDITHTLSPLNPKALIIIVSNPVDLLTSYLQDMKILPRHQIFGSGTYLDSERLKVLLATKLKVAPESIHAYILGEHGDSQFAPWSIAHCNGTPILQWPNITSNQLMDWANHAKQKAYEIIACKGSTYYGIATCITSLCKCIIFDQKLILPVSWHHPEYNICLGFPCIIGEEGIEKIAPLNLEKEEQKLLEKSAHILQKNYT